MLTGDNFRTARSVAHDLGIPSSNVMADVLPAGKIEYIKRLRLEGERVAMVGDGINDSPAVSRQSPIFFQVHFRSSRLIHGTLHLYVTSLPKQMLA